MEKAASERHCEILQVPVFRFHFRSRSRFPCIPLAHNYACLQALVNYACLQVLVNNKLRWQSSCVTANNGTKTSKSYLSEAIILKFMM